MFDQTLTAMRLRRFACVIGLVVALPWLARPSLQQQNALALVGGLIYVSPVDPPIADGVLIVRDGKITAVGSRRTVPVPAGIPTIDCRGLIVTAGFWNSHVHFVERKWENARSIPADELRLQLEEMLTRFGVTNVFDTGSDWANTRSIRDRIDSGEVPGPKIRSTGSILYPKGVGDTSNEQFQLLGFMKVPSPEIDNAVQGRDEAKKLLDAGTDGIKLYVVPFFAPTVSIPDVAIAAAVAEAHSRGKLAFAHPTNRPGLLAAVANGVDVIVHTTPQSGPWDDAILAEMLQRKTTLIPTLKLWRYELRHDSASFRERFVETGVGQLQRWVAAGGAVLFGTDVGYMSDYDPTEEYILMGKAGMSFRQILASLTTAPAERFGRIKAARSRRRRSRCGYHGSRRRSVQRPPGVLVGTLYDHGRKSDLADEVNDSQRFRRRRRRRAVIWRCMAWDSSR